MPTRLPNPNDLIFTIGTAPRITYNGTAQKTIDITADTINAAKLSHAHRGMFNMVFSGTGDYIPENESALYFVKMQQDRHYTVTGKYFWQAGKYSENAASITVNSSFFETRPSDYGPTVEGHKHGNNYDPDVWVCRVTKINFGTTVELYKMSF